MPDRPFSEEVTNFLDDVSVSYGPPISKECRDSFSEQRRVAVPDDKTDLALLDGILRQVVSSGQRLAGRDGFRGAVGPFNSDD